MEPMITRLDGDTFLFSAVFSLGLVLLKTKISPEA